MAKAKQGKGGGGNGQQPPADDNRKPERTEKPEPAGSPMRGLADQVVGNTSEDLKEVRTRRGKDADELAKKRDDEAKERERLRKEAEERAAKDAEREQKRVEGVEAENKALEDKLDANRKFWRNFWIIAIAALLLVGATALITYLLTRDPAPPAPVPTQTATGDPLFDLLPFLMAGDDCGGDPCGDAPASTTDVDVRNEPDMTPEEEAIVDAALEVCKLMSVASPPGECAGISDADALRACVTTAKEKCIEDAFTPR